MVLTVKQLKKALRGVPDDATVVLVDHDHSEDEFNGCATSCGHDMPGDERCDAYQKYTGRDSDIFWLKV